MTPRDDLTSDPGHRDAPRDDTLRSETRPRCKDPAPAGARANDPYPGAMRPRVSAPDTARSDAPLMDAPPVPHTPHTPHAPSRSHDPTERSRALPDAACRPDTAPALICMSHLRWDFVTQRPQHLMDRFARDRRVLFWEEEIPTDHHLPYLEFHAFEGTAVQSIRPRIPDRWPAQARMTALAGLFDQMLGLTGIRRPVLWLYTPMMWPVVAHVDAAAVVYDCMDELSSFRFAPPALRALEGRLMEAADLVTAGGWSLWEARRGDHANIHAFPSSVETGHFAAARGALPAPADQACLPGPRLGWYGVIDERLDLGLIAALAAARPDWSIVMIGPVVKIDPASLPRAANLHWLGQKPYEALPAYLAGWDAALMPFALNEATRFISPTKTPEYLAAGCPVVSTPVRDVVRQWGDLEVVHLAAAAPAFVEACAAALAQPRGAGAPWAAADRALAQLSWDTTQRRMAELVDAAVTRRGQGPEPVAGQADRPTRGRTPVLAPIREKGQTHAQMPAMVPEPAAEPAPGPRAAPAPDAPFAQADAAGVARSGGSPAVVSCPQAPRPPGAPPRGRIGRPDVTVCGAGFAGAVLARQLAERSDCRVLVVDRRDHVGGIAHDEVNPQGLRVPRYGAQLLHMDVPEVVAYLSRFAEWRPCPQPAMVRWGDQTLPLPLPIDRAAPDMPGPDGPAHAAQSVAGMGAPGAAPGVHPAPSDEASCRHLVEAYARKRWGLEPAQLAPEALAALPFHDAPRPRAVPRDGYAALFAQLLDHPGIALRTGTDFHDLDGADLGRMIVYTGAIDAYFGHRLGHLPWRGMSFVHEIVPRRRVQPAGIVIHPDAATAALHVTEHTHLTGQDHPMTAITRETPAEDGEPVYPIPSPANHALLRRYQALARAEAGVVFAGRMGSYADLSLDQVVAQALALHRRMAWIGANA